MDKTLAEIYGTNQSDDDQEKLAAAAAAEELTEDGAIDLDGLTEDDLEEMAAEVLASDASEETEEETEEVDEDMQEKVAEADQMGRIMAHAFVQERREIEKVAFLDKAKAQAGKASNAIERGERKIEKKVVKGAKWAGGKIQAGAKAAVNSKAGEFALKHGKKAGKFALKHRGKGLLLAGAAGGTAYATKEASAFETLAEQRAQEIFEASGIQEPGTETTKYDVLADAVEQRAAEILAEAGYEMVESDE